MIPRKVRIKGHMFAVKQIPKSKLPSDCQGCVEPDKNIIHINKRLPASRKIEVILHECMHAMLSGHKIFQEEEVCSVLGEYFVEFIRDNPDFIRHCLKTLERQ